METADVFANIDCTIRISWKYTPLGQRLIVIDFCETIFDAKQVTFAENDLPSKTLVS